MAAKLQKYARKGVEDGLVDHASTLTLQIAAVFSSCGYDQFLRLQRCKPLKTTRFPAVLRLVCEQIGTHHFDPVYESTV